MQTSSATDSGTAGAEKHPAGSRFRDSRAGFTLMEVVVALAIVGLLASLGLAFVRPFTGVAALRAKTAEIAALLRSDRNAALRSGKTSTVLVDADRRMIESPTLQTRIDIPSSMAIRVLPSGQRGVQFFADGRASNLALSLTSGGKTFLIQVNGITAAVDTRIVAP